MQILGYRKKTAEQTLESVSSSKPLPLLAAVTFYPSRFLLRFYRCAYGVFAFALLMVCYPFILEQPAWLILLVFLWWGLWRGYRYSLAQEPIGALSFSGEHWMYEPTSCNPEPLLLAGEVLCWSWVIILPLRDSESGKACNLLIFSDALTASDNARLRRWLQACLVPKG